MAASTLYEAVEPQLTWKYLLMAVFRELSGDGDAFEVRCNLDFDPLLGCLFMMN